MCTRRLLAAVAVSVLLPAMAMAQVRFAYFRPINTGPNLYTFGGSYPSYYGGGYYGGGYGSSYYGGGYYGGGYYGGGYYGGMNPYGYGYGMVPSYYTSSILPAGFGGYSGQIILPGWTAGSGDLARTRHTLSPAVQVEASEVRPIAYAGDNYAVVVVKLPDSRAEVFFNDVRTKETGAIREFITPQLDTTSKYSYDITVRMPGASGGEMRRTVNVRPGERIVVDFTKSN